MTDDNNSTRKLAIEVITKPDGSRWIDVLLLKYGKPSDHPRFRPSFHDLHRILQAIAECEDLKYPPPKKGRYKLLEFLIDAIKVRDFNVLAKKHNIPERDGDTIVNANGAKLKPSPLTADDIKWGSR